MSRVRVVGFTVSLDGFGTGTGQSFDMPFGDTGHELQQWMYEKMISDKKSEGDPDDVTDALEHSPDSIGAYIMGRNMFSPNRGEEDDSWKGWWGSNPPYHCPVYVMTHYPREEIVMDGGTIFRFVSGTPQEVLAIARETAGEKDVQVGGGVTTMRAFLKEGLVDEALIRVAPVMVGHGERLWDGLGNLMDTYELTQSRSSGDHAQLRFARRLA